MREGVHLLYAQYGNVIHTAVHVEYAYAYVIYEEAD